MHQSQNVLLASHGTDGARAAEKMVLTLCSPGAKVHHLVVVPTLWKGMTGDDWLNNGKTRNQFRRYVEATLENEITEHCDELKADIAGHGLVYSNEIIVGETDDTLLDVSRQSDYDLIIMGSPRPKGKTGLKSRMHVERLLKSLTVPLLIVPYPVDS